MFTPVLGDQLTAEDS